MLLIEVLSMHMCLYLPVWGGSVTKGSTRYRELLREVIITREFQGGIFYQLTKFYE